MSLISREAAIKAIDDLPNCYNGYSDTYDKAFIIGVLEELPTIDIIGIIEENIITDIVRCRDCRWYEIYQLKQDGTDDRRYNPSYCTLFRHRFKPDWYCADGERKGEE